MEVAGSGGGGGRARCMLRHCPVSLGYCCDVLDPESNFVFLLSRHSLVTNQILPPSSALPQSYGVRGDAADPANDASAAIAVKMTARHVRLNPQRQWLP